MNPVDPLPCLVWIRSAGRWLAGVHTHDTTDGRPFCRVHGEHGRSYPARFVYVLPSSRPQLPPAAPVLLDNARKADRAGPQWTDPLFLD